MSQQEFAFSAVDSRGRKVRGRKFASSARDAHAELRRDGLAPTSIKPASSRWGLGARHGVAASSTSIAEFLRALGMLLAAGAPLVTAIRMVGEQSRDPAVERLGARLESDIAGGRAVATSLSEVLGRRTAFVSGLVAAGEASGELAQAFEEAADQIDRDAKLAEEFWAAMSYPLFILGASIAAILVLLLVVVPSIAPLITEEGVNPPMALKAMIAVSGATQSFGVAFLAALALSVTGVLLAARLGLLRDPFEVFILDGPFAQTARSLVFGRFSAVLGHLLASGVPSPEAFRIASAGVASGLARARIDVASERIFEGVRVSVTLASCRGVPDTIVRMAAVGEETGRLGQMLKKAGLLEQQRAVRFLQQAGRWLAPAMIILLGLMIGAIMGGLLSGVASLGDAILE